MLALRPAHEGLLVETGRLQSMAGHALRLGGVGLGEIDARELNWPSSLASQPWSMLTRRPGAVHTEYVRA